MTLVDLMCKFLLCYYETGVGKTSVLNRFLKPEVSVHSK